MDNFFQDDTSVSFVIHGEPASKANSRRMVTIKGKPRMIKSKKALDYCKLFGEQCPTLDKLFEGDVSVEITIYYASRRPDLDESVILDEMQGKIYTNDRQVKQKHIHWGLDRDNPRSHICVKVMEGSDSTGDT
jgi:Holliday junction resolvase RusA-like endonuclease